MQQPLIIDQKAMAEKAMAELLAGMARLNAAITPAADMNRAQVRRFRAKMRPLQEKLDAFRVKQMQLQNKIDALGLGHDA